MKVFLTGGTGFIGQPLTQALLARGWQVTALVRKPDSPQAQIIQRMGAQLAEGDVTQRASMRAAMTGVDLVVHNAGHYEYGVNRTGREQMHAVNAMGTEHLLSLAEDLHIPRTLYVSTVVAFGETGPQPRDESFTRQVPCRTAYEQHKTTAHTVARRYQQRGLPLVIVCPSGVVGPNDHAALGYFLRLYLNRLLPPVAWSPNTIHTFVYLADLVDGMVLATEKGRSGETYFLCGEARPFREHLQAWRNYPGAFTPRFWLPSGVAGLALAPMEPVQRWLGLPAFMSRETVIASATHWYFSNAKAQRELGWRPRSAEAMWAATLAGELALLARRKGQSLLQRLRPLAIVE